LRGRALILALCAALAIAGCGGGSSKKSTTADSNATTAPPVAPPQRTKPAVTVPKGPAPKQLVVKDLIKGTGAVAQSGSQVTVQYVGVDYKTGKQFDASWDRGQPFPFQLGGGQVIPGWDKGVAGMRIGGRRELIIPASLAYGAQGQPPVIGPNATLVFVIDLLGVQ
jgi:peptidylprolyl isomerase